MKRIWWLFIGFCIGITPYINTLANNARGYNALGGEIFIPALPLILWLIVKVIREAIAETVTIMQGQLSSQKKYQAKMQTWDELTKEISM